MAQSAYQPRKSSPWIAVAVAAGTVLAAALILGGFLVHAMFRSQPLPVRGRDRELLITAGFFADWLAADVVLRSDAETFSRLRHPEETVELAYAYEHPEQDMTLAVQSTVLIAAAEHEAQQLFRRRNQEARGALLRRDAELHFHGRNDLFSWGDESYYATLAKEDAYRGEYFIARRGSRILQVTVFGDQLQNQGDFPALVTPILEQLEEYRP